MKIFINVFLSFFGLFILFCIIDCSVGKTKHLECSVISHEYKAAWVETVSVTDTDGNISFSTITHPEEYHVFCLDLETQKAIDVLTTSTEYYNRTNGQSVTLRVRMGKWTNKAWIPVFDD